MNKTKQTKTELVFLVREKLLDNRGLEYSFSNVLLCNQ